VSSTRPPVTVIVPCFNEVEALPALLQRLRAMRRAPRTADWHFLFVDDGSTDDSFAALLQAAHTEPGVEVVRLPENLGLGAALRVGFAQARSEIVCTLDSDCTYAPEHLPKLTQLIEEGADIATASAWQNGGDGDGTRLRPPWNRRLSAIYQRLVNHDVHTLSCLFRAYRRTVLENVRFRSNGYSAVAEIALKAVLAGYNLRELPMPPERRANEQPRSTISDAMLGHTHLIGLTLFAVCTRHALQVFGRSLPKAQ
jgi:dolichol-phosphate mannosyltransferase